MTSIERLQSSGILRLGTPRRGFRYRRVDGKQPGKPDLKRIQNLKIPPAWTAVAINLAPTGRVQVIGKDAAGRWQYLYHANHVRVQELRKFRRLIRFAEALPELRRTVRRHIKDSNLGRERVMACIVRILSSCFIRPGSEVYASENGSYGIATLRHKHVEVKGDVVHMNFPGKSGVRQYRELKDRRVAETIKALLKLKGPEVFKYKNGEGNFVDVKSRQINEYIKGVMGEQFTAKDFRTWAGTLVCACALARAGNEVPEKGKLRERQLAAAIKETADALGNTPAVCRSSYICPAIIDSFLTGKIIDRYFGTLRQFISYRGLKLHPAEKALLKLLKKA